MSSARLNDRAGAMIGQDLVTAIIDPPSYGIGGNIREVHRWLRQNKPLGLAEAEGYDPFWVVTKHQDIRDIETNVDVFRSEVDAIFLTDRAGQKNIEDLTSGYRANLLRSVLTLDPPHHAKMRRIAQNWFSPKNLSRLTGRIEAISGKLINEMIDAGGVYDFASEVALHLPIRVILEIMGIPAEDEPILLRLTQDLLGAEDPDFARDGTEAAPAKVTATMGDVFAEFTSYFSHLVEKRRANPGEDVATVIALGKIDGEPIRVEDAVSYYITLATAGHDTTSSSLAGAVDGLCDFPGEWQKVRADPSKIQFLTREAFRWTTPIRHFMRTCVADTEIGGVKMRPGDRTMLNYLSGNRDETVFKNPEAFVADRDPNPHLAFGYGPHVCLGQHLAKLELRIFFEQIVGKVRHFEHAGPVRDVNATLIGGLKSLPIRIET